jgi:glutamyl-tRNA(Gln) amidotransferase subunit E
MSTHPDDALLLVWGNELDADTACQEIIIRAREAATGIPSDTRQALKDGTSGFERVLPGADRMYPDTDLPPLAIPPERIEQIRQHLPEYIWDRETRYRAMGLSEAMVEALSLSPYSDLFSRLVDRLKIHPTFAAVVLCQRLKAFRRRGLSSDLLTDDEITEVFKAHADGRLAREGVVYVLHRLLDGRVHEPNERLTVADVLGTVFITPDNEKECTARIKAALNGLDHDRFPTLAKEHRYLMGFLMREFRGRIDGCKVAQRLTEELDAHRGRDASMKVEA